MASILEVDQIQTVSTNPVVFPTGVSPANLTTTLSSSSTDSQIPSTKSVFTELELKATNFPGISAKTPLPASAISINYSTRVLTITPPLGYFDFYTDGGGIIHKYTKTGPIDFPAFTNTSGVWYFYFDTAGNPVTTQTAWSYLDAIAPVYRIIWNATLSGAAADLGNCLETHNNTISADDHTWKHKYGAIWVSGLDIAHNAIAIGSGAPAVNGSNSVVSLTSGKILDDNLDYNITSGTTGTNLWEQDLGATTAITALNAGQFIVRYQDNAGLVFNLAPSRFPFAFSAGNLIEYITATGVRTVPSGGNFVVYYLYAFTDPRNGKAIKSVSSPVEYVSAANARAASWTDLTAVFPTLADAEIRPLYKLMYEYRTGYDVGCKKAALREVTDLRKGQPITTITAIGSVPATSVINVPSGNISATNVQAAIDELDTEKIATTQNTLVRDPTGFVSPSLVVVSYDSTARTITLTGTITAYWQGVSMTTLQPTFVSGWVSAAHTATAGKWYLYFDGTNFTWSQSIWSFDMLMIAMVYYGTTDKFGIRESHGLMNWLAHKEFHETIGTHLSSGGDLGGVTLNSTTAAQRRPTISVTNIDDEDLPTANAALSSSLYTQFYLTGAAVPTFVVDATDIVPLLTSINPYYNLNTGGTWSQAVIANNNYMAVWLISVPAAADATSQKYRYIWMQGQSASGTLATIQGLTPANLTVTGLDAVFTEYTFIGKVIVRFTASNWIVVQIDKLSGNRFNQVSSTGGTYLSAVTTDTTLSGSGTAADPLLIPANVALPGSPTTTTAAADTNTTAIATTAFVQSEKNIRQNSKSADYTLVLTDAGKHIYHPSADTTSRTFIIPANGTVAFNPGTAITFINDVGGGDITIAITTDTLVLLGPNTVGSVLLTSGGMATAIKVTATRWVISGNNLVGV